MMMVAVSLCSKVRLRWDEVSVRLEIGGMLCWWVWLPYRRVVIIVWIEHIEVQVIIREAPSNLIGGRRGYVSMNMGPRGWWRGCWAQGSLPYSLSLEDQRLVNAFKAFLFVLVSEGGLLLVVRFPFVLPTPHVSSLCQQFVPRLQHRGNN